MLSSIYIKDLVIVRQLNLNLESGMTALTGETGAGKSILIDALGLALGDKPNVGMIRQGCDKAEVTAIFDLRTAPAAREWLQKHDLDYDDECILRRIVSQQGRARAYINGAPCTQTLLRELGGLLVDIHGQHAHQSLIQTKAQRELLDAYAGHFDLLTSVANQYTNYKTAKTHYDELVTASVDRSNRLDYLRFQIDELQHVACDANALDELSKEQQRLAHAERILSETNEVNTSLNDSVESILGRAVQTLSGLSELDEGLKEAHELLDSAAIQVNEANSLLSTYQNSIELDPERLQEVDNQLGQIHDSARKHRVQPEELTSLLSELEAEYNSLENADNTLQSLEVELNALKLKYENSATKLSTSRNTAAKKLSGIVTQSMQELAMDGGKFSINCNTNKETLNTHGQDDIEFMVAANLGQAPAPLGKVASGGELSRISLAIQVATANCGEIPTLIFDEVDVGIGGAVAEIVGKLLRELGIKRQILCVTHLPQVASQGHQQLQVQKSSDGTSTETAISPLDDDERIHEIARMLGGIDISDQTLKTAQEMVSRAQVS